MDDDLKKARESALLDMLGKQQMEKPKPSGRELTPPQATAIKCLETENAFEVMIDSLEYGDDKVDPISKQVRPFEKRKRLLFSQDVYPEEKEWIEHIMKALQGINLKRKELELIKKHIKRLNYQGALRDYYEFFGMSIKELREKEREYRQQGSISEADRMRRLLNKVDKKMKKNVERRKES